MKQDYMIGEEVYLLREGARPAARGTITNKSGRHVYTFEVTTPDGKQFYSYGSSISRVPPLKLLGEQAE